MSFITEIKPSPAGGDWVTDVHEDEVIHYRSEYSPQLISEFPLVDGFFATEIIQDHPGETTRVIAGPFNDLQSAIAFIRLTK